MNASRISLALAGSGREAGWQSNLRWFRLFILMHMAGRSFLMIPTGPTADLWVQLLRSVIVVTALLGCIPRFSLWATRAAALLLVGEIAITIPFTANHVFLEFLCLGFLSLLDERDQGEAALLMQALRWFVGVFFFYTGLQKLLYGYYFDGQLLAYLAGTEDRFAAFFRFIIPAEELQRLQSYNEDLVRPGAYSTKLGAGPYRVDSLLFVVMSNGVYLFEMLAGILLLVPRTRVLAAVASIGFVIMIEIGARELTFGALMVNLLLLFLPGRWIKWAYPAFLVGYLYLAAHKLGLAPMFAYAPA